MNSSFIHRLGLSALILAAAGGCSVTPIGFASNLVGDTVTDSDVQKKQEQLRGANPLAADELFGAREDTMRGVNRNREWIVYPAGDIMNNKRYVVEVAGDRIVAVSKVQKNRDMVLNTAQKASYEKKVIGFSPAQCERNLELGKPRLQVRSTRTGDLIQLYDARFVKKINKPHYALLRFGPDKKCKSLELATVQASSKPRPFD